MANPKTNYKTSTGQDLGDVLVTKEYIMDVFPDLLPSYNENTLWGFGPNNYGQLGNNSVLPQSSPVQTVAGGTNWKQVVCQGARAFGIKTDGTLWVWGDNQYGQLGNNSVLPQSSPVQTVAGGTNWKQVACSTYHTAAIKTDGTLWLWGSGTGGRLGTNDILHRSSPVQTISGGTNWKQVACGQALTAAIKTDGTLWLWGGNQYGQLGNNLVLDLSSPVQTVAGGTNWKHVTCGDLNSAAIKTDGTLWTWGSNGFGKLGTNDILHRSSPVQTISGGTNWKQVACGFNCTAAIKTDGTLWVWGGGTLGQLGNNLILDLSSPVQTVAGGNNWKQVDCGMHISASKTDGTLWTWGYNGFGQLGTNDILHRSSPVQTIAGGTNWKQVACGENNTIAIKDEVL